MEEVLQRLRQQELANTALQDQLREAQKSGEERYRHDRDAARQEAEETVRQVAEATAVARMRNMPLMAASVDGKLARKPETVSESGSSVRTDAGT